MIYDNLGESKDHHKMRICFLYTPDQELNKGHYSEKMAENFSKSAQILPPLGMAYLAALLRQKGFTVGFLDANALGLTEEQILNKLHEFKPDCLLYTTITDNFQYTLGWIKNIKQKLDVPAIVGGPHMSLYPKETLTHHCIDYGVVGDGWETLPELLQTIQAGGDLSTVKSIVYRKDGEIMATEYRSQSVSLEDVPFPARDIMPLNHYDTVLTKSRPIGIIITALGCPFRCTYCVTDTNLRSRSAEHVVAEIEECVNKYGIKEITFYDETFTVNRKRVTEILDLLEEKKLKFSWIVRTRADCVDKEMIERMARLGCIEIRIGIESGDEKVLRSINRFIPLERIRNVVKWSKQAGLVVFGFFMVGLPGETKEEIMKTLKFMLELDLDFVEINKFVPLPGSQIYENMKRDTGQDFWRDYTLGKVSPEQLKPYQRGLSEEELNRLLEKSYRRFYYRPRYVWKRLVAVKSWKEFKKLVSAAWSLR
ncbi:hypothetical protein CL634_10495 [bacterium]|nr:hypothetical protein [bacterium]